MSPLPARYKIMYKSYSLCILIPEIKSELPTQYAELRHRYPPVMTFLISLGKDSFSMNSPREDRC